MAELKAQLDTLSSQLQQGLQQRNVDVCMEAIRGLKGLGANVTFSLAPDPSAQQAYGQDPSYGQASAYPSMDSASPGQTGTEGQYQSQGDPYQGRGYQQ